VTRSKATVRLFDQECPQGDSIFACAVGI
jgi:hypothetical protein